MSKIFSSGDMYNYAKEHPEAKFKRKCYEHCKILRYRFDKDGNLLAYNEGEKGSWMGEIPKLNEQWELIPQEVPWQEAIQAWVDGKNFRVEMGYVSIRQLAGIKLGGEMSGGGSIDPKYFIDGKWFIEE